MGIPCDLLADALKEYKKAGKRGAMAQLSRESNVTENVLSRIINKKQKYVEYDTWKKIYDIDRKLFPEPIIESRTVGTGIEDLITKYPVVGRIIETIKESVDGNHSQKAMIQILMKQLDFELEKLKSPDSNGLKRTG